MNQQQQHPTPDQLAAYSRGELADLDDREIEDHLQECDTCCDTLNSLPEDTLIAMIRSEHCDVASASAGPVPSAQPASELETPLADHPRYRIIDLVGEGGMGAVYRAEHRMMRRCVAIKLINPRLINRPGAVDRFHREVQAAARLSHPNIVASYDAEQVDDLHFLVMEFVDGRDLADIVKQRGPLPVAEACDYIRQAALGLQHAYEQGMVHRDIKPHNLMLANQEQSVGPRPIIKILDFGLASLCSDPQSEETADDEHLQSAEAGQLTLAGSMMGTPDFISPEQAHDARSADTRSDIYSLGATLYYLLAGRPPFALGTIHQQLESHRQRNPDPIDMLRPDVPAELAEVINRMMAKSPADRFRTPQQVVDAITRFIDQKESVPPSTTRRSLRWQAAVVATLLGVLSVLTAVAYMATDKGTLEIRTNSHDVQIVIRQNGKIVEIVDQGTEVPLVRLRSGKYEIQLTNETDRLRLSKDAFELRRDGKVIVEVRPIDEAPPFQPQMVRQFRPSDETISQDGVAPELGGWRIDATRARTVRLFEVEVSNIDECILLYQAKLRTENLGDGQAYLEMLCHLPALGDAFSRYGQLNPLTGTTNWVSCETPMFVQKGQKPDIVRLNVVVKGKGTVWIKDIVLRTAPLTSVPFFQPTTPY